MNLAADREHQLSQTSNRLGVSGGNLQEETLTRLQVETAKEIGGFQTRMLLDAPREIAKYHFAPLQIALCVPPRK